MVVMLGGSLDSSAIWGWDGGASATSAHVMSASYLPAAMNHAGSVEEVSFLWFAGGTGYSEEGATVNGADLNVWDQGRWKKVAENGAAVDAPEVLQWTGSDPRFTRRVFLGDSRTLNVAVTPAAPNGRGSPGSEEPGCENDDFCNPACVDDGDCDHGRIASDYVQVKVRYRLGRLLGWGFNTPASTEGWTVENLVDAAEPADGIWSFLLDTPDVRLVSPGFNEEADGYTHLQVVVRSENPDSSCAILWQEQGLNQFDQDRSVGFEVEGDGKWHLVRVPLDHAEWAGRITRLRFDLPQTPGNQLFEIDRIELTD